jgi:hypothetical protein
LPWGYEVELRKEGELLGDQTFLGQRHANRRPPLERGDASARNPQDKPLDLHRRTRVRWSSARVEKEDTMGMIRILDATGDTAVAWDITDAASVQRAEEMFDRLTSERKIPFARAYGAPVEETVQIKTFDPHAEEIILVRPIAGG